MSSSEGNTLLIKHLPRLLSPEDREEMLKLVGAVKVRIMPDSGRMKYSAFATFQNHEDAKRALSLLHQREVLGRRMVAEFSKQEHLPLVPHSSDYPKFNYNPAKEKTELSEKEVLKKDMEDFSMKIHCISPSVGLDYLPNPLLKYKYPPPTPTILQNIGHALASVPKFYNQVLHLMNKMNLPAPFGSLTPAPPITPDNLIAPPVSIELPVSLKPEVMDIKSSDEESEYESEEEEGQPKVMEKVFPQQKRKADNKPKHKVKRQKLTDLIPSAHNPHRQRVEPSEVFESLSLSQKKISVKKITQIAPAVAETTIFETTEGFGEFETPRSEEPEEKKPEADSDFQNESFISRSELKKKRLSSREMKTMSIFRNFSPGEPTLRLYIKNLAKQVSEKDLRYIFGRFINWDSEEEKIMFDVRLMKEGRMKGQAFVTLANQERAVEAVRETNGFILHTKPLVVQFARSAKPKENEKKS